MISIESGSLGNENEHTSAATLEVYDRAKFMNDEHRPLVMKHVKHSRCEL